MSRYTVLEKVGDKQAGNSFDVAASGVPSGNGVEQTPAAAGTAWVSHDFVLVQDRPGPVYVPAPIAGHVHRTGTYGGVEIYDATGSGRRLLGRVLHLDPRSIAIAEGARVAYGQPLGRQWGAGEDNTKTQAESTRVELHAAQLRRYLDDIASGLIAPDAWPGRAESVCAGRAPVQGPYAPVQPHPAFDDETEETDDADDDAADDASSGATSGAGDHRELDAVDLTLAEVRELQALLNALGHRDAVGNPLRVDGDFDAATRAALAAFRRANGLDVAGVTGAKALAALRKSERQPLISNPDHPDHALYKQALAGLENLPAGTFKNAQERSNAAAMLVFEARVQGLEQIDHVTLDANGSTLSIVQGGMHDAETRRFDVDKARAIRQAVEKSSADLERERALLRQRALDLQRQMQVQAQLEEQRARRRGLFRG